MSGRRPASDAGSEPYDGDTHAAARCRHNVCMHPRQHGHAPAFVERSARRVAPASSARDCNQAARPTATADLVRVLAIRARAAVPVGWTLLPLSKTGQGWVRIWEFPRAQITAVGLLAQAALWRWGSNSRDDRARPPRCRPRSCTRSAELAFTPGRKAEVTKPAPTAGDVEHAQEVVDDAREVQSYVDEGGKGRVTKPSRGGVR